MPKVHIDDIIQTLQKDHEDTPADENARNDLWYPGDMGITGPGKPEEPDGEDDSTKDHRWQALFWDDAAVLLELAGETGLRDPDDGAAAEEHSDEDTNERKGPYTLIPATTFLEGNGVGFKEEVENAVDEG